VADAFVALGDRAIRFARPRASTPRAIVRAARAWPHVVDVVVARDDVAIYFDREPRVDAAAIAALADLADDPEPPREHALHAIYDGEDLAEIARATGLDVDEVVRRHAAAAYTVETMGFAPGFAYMTGLDARLRLPRRATPRTSVAASSIAIAGEFTGVYPFATPGGWHVLGRVVDTRMFGPDGPLLHLGDRVRFVPC
jgi:KipI family sensor histidine kinase inhibitor